MTALLVKGGKRLTGRIEPSANKNAVLPVLCATLLSDAPITLRTPRRGLLRSGGLLARAMSRVKRKRRPK